MYFNPRTREGCDNARYAKLMSIEISIHAPARGATLPFMANNRVLVISIHAPARGATSLWIDLHDLAHISIHAPARGATGPCGSILVSAQDFNPRTREGCDGLTLDDLGFATEFQSTHPRGVRHALSRSASAGLVFQSTHPRGVRRIYTDSWPSSTPFQSTHPRGVRRLPHGLITYYTHFNPRTREGCDMDTRESG